MSHRLMYRGEWWQIIGRWYDEIVIEAERDGREDIVPARAIEAWQTHGDEEGHRMSGKGRCGRGGRRGK